MGVRLLSLAAVMASLLAAGGATAAPSAARATYVGITAGTSHTCALTTGGGVKCWGTNVSGVLGTGIGTPQSIRPPTDVTGLRRGVRAIDGDHSHTCALTTGGGVKCWGSNLDGRLAHRGNRLTDGYTPVDVIGFARGARAVSAGSGHTCALTTGGGVRCWGAASYGQLGSGTTIRGGSSRTPFNVAGLASGVRAISAGGGLGNGHTCAVTNGGGAKCWGGGFGGQLGNGATTNSNVPVDVAGLTSGVKAISAGGGHTCALTTGGGVKCWGSNTQGQLGNGARPGSSTTPVDVVGLTSGVTAISAGGNYTCALTSGGGVKCWGLNDHGQLGTGSTTSSNVPVDVVGLGARVKAIAAGLSHVCALTSGGAAKCWGWNALGQLGDGTKVTRTRPVDVRPAMASAPTKPPTSTNVALRSFADRMGRILQQSAAGRRELGLALTAGFNCSSSARATAQRVGRVVANRQGLLRQLATIKAPSARATNALRLFRQALQHSIEADIRYRDGFLALGASRCPLPPNRNFTLARQSDTRASAAKRSFVAVYNPLARSVGRRTWSANEI